MAGKGGSSVQEGGFWSASQAQYSPQTQKLLKEMMQESKLNNFQQRHIRSQISGGGALPPTCHPTSSAKPRKPVVKPPPAKVLNPRNYSGGVKSKDRITQEGAYQPTDYRPRPAVVRTEKDKDRLANFMAYGTDIEPANSKALNEAQIEAAQQRIRQKEELDRFEELEKEVEERQNFLTEMESLGQGAKYRTIIATEISQKLREMELIDKTRNDELEALVAAQSQDG